MKFEADIRLTTKEDKYGSRFAFDVDNVKFSLPSDSMDVTMHGDYFGHLAGPFKAIFEKELHAHIATQIEAIVQTNLPLTLNQEIKDSQRQILIGENLKFDSHLSNFPMGVMFGRIYFGLKGFSVVGQDRQAVLEKETCEKLTHQINRTTFSEPETFRMFFSTIDEERTGEILDFVKKVKWDSDFRIDFLNLFTLTELGSEERKDSVSYMTATVERAVPYEVELKKRAGSAKKSFWVEHLDKYGNYSRKQTKPLALMVHTWLAQYYDKFGIVKMIERMYLPWVYWLLGEKMA